jgi:hypothetical protein
LAARVTVVGITGTKVGDYNGDIVCGENGVLRMWRRGREGLSEPGMRGNGKKHGRRFKAQHEANTVQSDHH